MLSEHNPIAELVHQIQKKWIEEASPFPGLKLVRWLIKPEEARLYEGFLKLESTEHGAIPEILVAMLSPFTNENEYSLHIINDWIKAFREDAKTQEKLKTKGMSAKWPGDKFISSAAGKNDDDQRLLQMLSSFQNEMTDKNMPLVVALFPHSIHDMKGFNRWLNTILKKDIPTRVSFMIFDHIGENYFDDILMKHPQLTKSIHVNLDLDGAISKIAKTGDTNSPEVKLRECILEMGQAVQKNDQRRLDEWGEKALAITQRSGSKSMFASAHLIYAGMLFTFKQFDKIDSLLLKGLSISQQGLKLDDVSCKPLNIQFYGYIAASKQLQKKMPEAINAFEKQGDTATAYQLPGMALTPYQQAYTLSKKNLPQRHDALLQKAFSAGSSMQKEEQLHSSFAAVALDFWQWLEMHQRWEEANKTDMELRVIFGYDWKEKARLTGPKYALNTKNAIPVN